MELSLGNKEIFLILSLGVICSFFLISVFGNANKVLVSQVPFNAISGFPQSCKTGSFLYGLFEGSYNCSESSGVYAWDDEKVSVLGKAARGGTASDPTLKTFMNGTMAFAFNKNTMNEVFSDIQFPHSYAQGQSFELHYHWAPSDASYGCVVWGAEYTISSISGTFPSTVTLKKQVCTQNISFKHQMVDFGYISGTNLNISSVMSVRMFRDATNTSDTYDADAFLISMDAHIPKDSIGSSQEAVK